MARAIGAEGRGDRPAEEAHYGRAERLFRELGHTSALDAILSNRGYADIVAEDFESAERRLRELTESANGPTLLFASANHGLALARLGRLDEAEERFAGLLEPAVAERSTEMVFYSFEGLALVAACRAEDVRAARLWGVTAGITEATGYILATAEHLFHDELVPETRARLGEAEFDRAWNLGRQLSFDEALALALRRL
jgi:tetratricopeptide (TPR) repeat protein